MTATHEYQCPRHGRVKPGQINYHGHRCVICDNALTRVPRIGPDQPDGQQELIQALMEERDRLLRQLASGPDANRLSHGRQEALALRGGAMALELAAGDMDSDHPAAAAELRRRAGAVRRTADAIEEEA